MCNCNCKMSCTLFSVAVSIIIGIFTAFFRVTGVIATTSAFLWVVFGIGVVYLALMLIPAVFRRDMCSSECLCPSTTAVLTGALGSIAASVVLLGIEFAVSSVTGAVITGALFAFFSLTLTSTACLIRCLNGCSD